VRWKQRGYLVVSPSSDCCVQWQFILLIYIINGTT